MHVCTKYNRYHIYLGSKANIIVTCMSVQYLYINKTIKHRYIYIFKLILLDRLIKV